MNPMLRLCEDVLSNHAAIELPALPRMIFVVHGSIAIADRTLRDDEAFGGEGAIMLKAGSAGATLWRWELITREADFGRPAPGSGIISHEKLAAMLSTAPAGALLLRGGAWYETGPDGVFAQAADRPTRFIRVMILPRAYLGKSSVEYLNEADKAKPKLQSYKIFVDMPIELQT